MIPTVMPTYARTDVTFDHGAGAYLFDSQGKRYLDFGSGVAVNSLGHAHPHLVKALQEQAAKLWHTSNLYRVAGQEKLAERLVAATFADTVFFCNSGAEAMECAIKMARKHHSANGHPERYRVIAATGAFHGRTLATIAAGGQAKHLEGFGPPVEGFDHVSFGNLNELRAAITPETAAVLLEPVQGESGVYPCAKDFLEGVRAACDEFGLLMILDEVQTGAGRTGALFAYQHYGIKPDIMGAAKGLGGGFPMGACLATESAAKGMTAGAHGSTFGGNPLAMAAANAVLDVMLADGFFDHVKTMSDRLMRGLKALVTRYPSVVSECRGLGLMLGLSCVRTNTDVIKALFANGLLTVPAGDNTVRVLPPLIVRPEEVDEALRIFEATFAALTKEAP